MSSKNIAEILKNCPPLILVNELHINVPTNKLKSETSQDLVLFNQVPWNYVDMQQHYDAVKINNEDAESLLCDQNFTDHGTILIRHDIHQGPYHLLL